MPELPEVETVRKGLARYLPGRRLSKVRLRRRDLRWPLPAAALESLEGRRCQEVSRRSKYLQLHFSGPEEPVALIHLGMSGQLFVDLLGKGAKYPAYKVHEHWRMDFGDRLLRYVDPRRFGMLDVVARGELIMHPRLRHLGPEPFSTAFDGEYLHQKSRRRKTAVKTLLMDARMVVGIGNIYASEICYLAGVRPRVSAGRLTRRQCACLVEATKAILRKALDKGGTTIRDYAGVDQEAGYFARSLMVYGRAGEACRRCGSTVKMVTQIGRSTYYCPHCQS